MMIYIDIKEKVRMIITILISSISPRSRLYSGNLFTGGKVLQIVALYHNCVLSLKQFTLTQVFFKEIEVLEAAKSFFLSISF